MGEDVGLLQVSDHGTAGVAAGGELSTLHRVGDGSRGVLDLHSVSVDSLDSGDLRQLVLTRHELAVDHEHDY